VLSAGAIASPALLLSSGVALPGIGKNLRDHPVAGIQVLPADPDALAGPGTRTQTALAYTASGSPNRNDMRISPYAGYPLDPNPVTGVQAPSGVRLTCTIELPLSSGELTLVPGAGGPEVSLEFNHLEEARDRESLRESIRLAVELARDGAWKGIGELAPDPSPAVLDSDRELDRWLLERTGSASHSVATCKLGPTADPLAVVDERCRVHGYEGLAVADLSIVPAPVRANPNATAVMVGERASDLLKEWR
jgi:choline dehydrogenase